MLPKIIITIENGCIQSVCSSVDIQYIVIDIDRKGDEPIIIGNVNEPDYVSPSISISEIEDEDTIKIAAENNHPWL